jgi:hypothetical protein
MHDTIVLCLRGGNFTTPLHAASVSADGRWLRVRSADLTPVSGAQVPEEPVVALAATSYGRTWAVIAQGAVIPTVERAVQAIRGAQPALQLAERILQGLVAPAAVPSPEPAAADLDDD